MDRVFQSLRENDIEYVQLGGVVPNPHLSLVYEGIELCKRGVDFILAVGGGSVIDSAKAIGYGMTNDGDVWDFYAKKRQATACLPIAGTILTILLAGSEMSDSSVITKEEGWLKRGYSGNYCRAEFAIMNPELTYTLPPYQTASGCADILMHTMERYFNRAENMDMTDGIAEALMRTVIENKNSKGKSNQLQCPC